MTHILDSARVPMRDGVNLAAKLFRAEPGPRPTLLLRTPYGLNSDPNRFVELHSLLDLQFNLLMVSTRGLGGSEGTFGSITDEAADGYDTVEWIISQPWSDGSVGTYGMSYMGVTQWAALSTGHPAIRASVVTESAQDWYRGLFYNPGGALSAALTTHWHTFISLLEESSKAHGPDMERIGQLTAGLMDVDALAAQTPLSSHPLLIDDARFHTVLDHPTYDAHWRDVNFAESMNEMAAPVLFVGGWFDIFFSEQLRDFERYTHSAGSQVAREHSRLVIGPWAHTPWSTDFAEVDFGATALMFADLNGEHLRHFKRWLSPSGSEVSPAAPVRIFVMGINQWRDEQAWPLPDTTYTDLYLDASSHELSENMSSVSAQVAYHYDPRDAVPTRGGTLQLLRRGFGPVSQADIQDRSDVITFTSSELREDTEVTGYVSATLFVSSDAIDTDFTGRLIDEHPDGTALSVCDGIIRMRYRDGVDEAASLTPGVVYEVTLQLAATSLVFRSGHRIRLDVSSSNFPRFDRNTNTGGIISMEAIHNSHVARNVVHTGPGCPSRLCLPVIRR